MQLHSDSVLNGDWSESIDFSYSRSPLVELSGQTMGLIGLGQIGKQTRADSTGDGDESYRDRQRSKLSLNLSMGIEWVQLDELLQRSDVISLHCPLTPQRVN